MYFQRDKELHIDFHQESACFVISQFHMQVWKIGKRMEYRTFKKGIQNRNKQTKKKS